MNVVKENSRIGFITECIDGHLLRLVVNKPTVPDFYHHSWFPAVSKICADHEAVPSKCNMAIKLINNYVLGNVSPESEGSIRIAITRLVECLLTSFVLPSDKYCFMKNTALQVLLKYPKLFADCYLEVVQPVLSISIPTYEESLKMPKKCPANLPIHYLSMCYSLRHWSTRLPFSIVHVPEECIDKTEQRLFEYDLRGFYEEAAYYCPSYIDSYLKSVSSSDENDLLQC